MPDDIITGDDEKVFTEFKDVLVYPNPVTDKIMLKTSREDLGFTLYDFKGQKVLKKGIDTDYINEINVSKLPEGYYIYSITRPDGKAIDGGKLLKQ